MCELNKKRSHKINKLKNKKKSTFINRFSKLKCKY